MDLLYLQEISKNGFHSWKICFPHLLCTQATFSQLMNGVRSQIALYSSSNLDIILTILNTPPSSWMIYSGSDWQDKVRITKSKRGALSGCSIEIETTETFCIPLAFLFPSRLTRCKPPHASDGHMSMREPARPEQIEREAFQTKFNNSPRVPNKFTRLKTGLWSKHHKTLAESCGTLLFNVQMARLCLSTYFVVVDI